MARPKMGRNSRGRFTGKARRNAPKKGRRRSPRSTAPAFTTMVVKNSPKKRHSSKRSAPKKYYGRRQRNPRFFGVNFNLQTIGFTVGGLVGTSYVEGFVRPYLPTAITGNVFGRYAVKLGSAFGLRMIVRMFAGPQAARAVLIGGLSAVGLSAVNEFLMPALTGGATGRYLGAQPLLAGARRPKLGAYPSFSGLGATRITSGVPDRLNPASRF